MWEILAVFLAKNVWSLLVGLAGGLGAVGWYLTQKRSPNPFNLLKFFGGFNIFQGAVIGKLAYWGIIAVIAIGIYHKTFIAPTYKTVDNSKTTIGTVQKYYSGPENRPDTNFYGIKAGPLQLGFRFQGREKAEPIKKEAVIKPAKKSFNLFNIFKKK